jgi:phosphonatase-like hydrolase
MITLAVLDMAGTTVTDDGMVEESFLAALGSVGIGPESPELAGKMDYIRATMGRSKIEVFTEMLGDPIRAQEANAAFETNVADAITAGRVAPIEGAEAVLAELREGGIQICLTTGFSGATRDLVVDQLGWQPLVDLVLAPEPGVRGRPFPDLVLTALLRLEVEDVHEIAVVGDTANDLTAGHRAGAAIVAGVLTGAHQRVELEAAPHTHILDSIRDLPEILPT